MSVQMERSPTAQIIISSVRSLADAVMPDLLATLGRRYPGIELHLREGIQADVIGDVGSGIADFAVGGQFLSRLLTCRSPPDTG
jgi:DNA-binding transcriptional LysR family regulator